MIKVYVDSAANIPAVDVKKYGITVIPFINLVDGEELPGFTPDLSLEEERAQGKKYYDAIRNGKEVKTSLVNAARFEEIFRQELEAGNDVLYFSLSKNISGTYNAARIAAEALEDDFDDHKVYLVDSLNASLAQGILAIYATMMIEKGTDIEDIQRICSDAALNMNGVFTVEDLKYLAATGRISNIKSLAGKMLNIKPILKGNSEGYIVSFQNIRTRKKSLNKLVDLVCKNIVEPEKQIVGIAHADAYEDSIYVINAILERVNIKEVINTSYDFCTGTHVGPGTIALFFMAENRELDGVKTGKSLEILKYI